MIKEAVQTAERIMDDHYIFRAEDREEFMTFAKTYANKRHYDPRDYEYRDLEFLSAIADFMNEIQEEE